MDMSRWKMDDYELEPDRKEVEQLRALVRHMDRCIQRGGPRNYVEFLDEQLAGVHAAAFE